MPEPDYKQPFLGAMRLLEQHAANALREIEVYELTDLDELERLRALGARRSVSPARRAGTDGD